MKNVFRSLAFFLVIFLVTGCSSGGKSPISPVDDKTSHIETFEPGIDQTPLIEDNFPPVSGEVELALIGDTFNSTGIFGIYELNINDDLVSAELTPVRSSALGESYTVSGAGFFTIAPCSDCLKIKTFELTEDNILKLIFTASHPFSRGNTSQPPSAANRLDLDVFDPALVIVPSSAESMSFNQIGKGIYHNLCANTDGFTTELSWVTKSSNACPYFLVVDDSDTGTSTFNKFAMGTKDREFDTYFTGNGNFKLYLTMGYGASAKKLTRLQPQYYNPEFNRKSAWKVAVTPPQGENPPTMDNTWTDIDSTTTQDVTVDVWDWQQNSMVSSQYPDETHPEYIAKASKVEQVSVEIPGMYSGLKTKTAADSGTGTPSSPLVFSFAIANENDLDPGDYYGLVKVTDQRAPSGIAGSTDSLVHTPDGIALEWYKINEFATYQIFTATVVLGKTITVTQPNGGESWAAGYPATIEWDWVGPITNVDIDLSINGGTSWTISLANNLVNTGSYQIPIVGDWFSEDILIRVMDSSNPDIQDQSDGVFEIYCPIPATPSNFTASDGAYTDHVALAWNASVDAETYNIYRDDVLIQADIATTSWNDYTTTRGILYDYDVESENRCGLSTNKASNTGYALGCTGDSNNSCTTATKLHLTGSAAGCVDQIDEDWYYLYVTPKGLADTSTLSLTIPSGTVNVYVYGRDPGESCPGSLINSATNTGSTTLNMPLSSKSMIYVKLIGSSGMVNYTLNLNFQVRLTKVNAEIYVATTNGTSTGTWPTYGSTPLTHATLLQMLSWANQYWAIYGYELTWDQTETFMASSYYVLNNDTEVIQMHNDYGYGSNMMSLYFVDQLQPGSNTAYCITYNNPASATVNNVFTVYSPNVWSWQNVIAHEHGHAYGYLQDQYLYAEAGCPCGNDTCLASWLGYTPYLWSDPLACYMGNQMYYADPARAWSWYNFTRGQRDWVFEFHFTYPSNFPWY